MLSNKRERRSGMDLDSTASHIRSRNSSLSLSENYSTPSALSGQPFRRSSASQVIPIISASISAATAKRSPLAPLDPQLSASVNAIRMPQDDQFSGRKPSLTLTNATRPTPYNQRNLPRRSTIGQTRRTSLPAINVPPESTPSTPSSVAYESTSSIPHDEDIYSQLSTFTFGDVPTTQTSLASSSKSLAKDTLEGMSPFSRSESFDRTPRPSVAPTQLLPPMKKLAGGGWSSPSEDEEESRRVSSRAKMRAIDDGGRRPSLPTNDPHQIDQRVYSDPSAPPSDKGKGKSASTSTPAYPRRQGRAKNTVDGDASTGSSSHTEDDEEGEHGLDTDVDVMDVDDYPDRRRRRRRRVRNPPLVSDHSGQITSDFGSICEEEDEAVDESIGVDEDEDEDEHSHSHWVDGSGRRGSLPMDIPYPAPHQRLHRQASQTGASLAAIAPFEYDYGPPVPPTSDFEMRILTQGRRPSRSLDDDLRSSAMHLQHRASGLSLSSGTGAGPSSEPGMRGIAISQAQASSAQNPGNLADDDDMNLNLGVPNEPYAGLDLNYILSVSGPLSGPGMVAGGSQSSIYDGRAGVDPTRVSIGSITNREREGSWTFGWGFGANVGRRPSTATVNDDTFLRFVKKNDFSYDERRREWSFCREKAEGDAGVSAGERPGQEIWRCVWVGRYKVERLRSKNPPPDPTKPPQFRLNVKHIPDPYSKGNTRGGPSTFIHKHSRAQAFSIFRGHALPQRHLKTSSSVLLAPKKVQEQFTSTRTTSKLSTHGLLEERGSAKEGRPRTSPASTSSTNASTSTVATTASASASATSSSSRTTAERPSSSRGTAPTKDIDKSEKPASVDRKGKGVARPTHVDSDESAAGPSRKEVKSPDSPHSSPRKEVGPLRLRPAEHPHRPTEPTSRPASSLAETRSVTSEGSHVFSSGLSTWDQYSIGSSNRDSLRPPPQQGLRQQLGRFAAVTKARGSVGSLDDQPAIRTSHAEAFATLDPPFLQHLRTQAAHFDGSGDQDSAPSRFRGLKKLFQGGNPPLKNAPKHATLPAGPSVAILDGQYTPPWLTMAARSKQEEQERVIKNLNDSFRDVGLLPSFKPGKNRAKGKGRRGSENVFDQIPDESLYMLLPMWPGETDVASAVYDDDPSTYEPELMDRQYLLVYYVPMLNKDKKNENKRTRTSQTSSANSHSDSSMNRDAKHNVVLSSFNILARLVSYQDVNGSGIRIPTIGLAVTGPMSDAVRAIPQIRFQMDDLALIIGFCDKRERGVEILPEGAEKLGLCLPRISADMDLDAPLSTLGRAAVEMAWLGALAVMGVGTPA